MWFGMRTLVACGQIVRALALLIVGGSGLLAQPQLVTFPPNPTKITGQPCAACRIEAVRVVQLGSDREPGTIHHQPWSAHMDSRNRIIVRGANDLPQLWSLDGRYIMSLGSKGDGPGEFRGYPNPRVGPGDSIWTFDGQRNAVFSPDGKFSRAFTTELRVSNAMFLSDNRILFNGYTLMDTKLEDQLFIMDRLGKVVTSFGRVPKSPPGGHEPFLGLTGSVLPNGDFWTRDGISYTLQHWRANGNMVRAVRRETPWFITRFNRPPDSQIPISIALDAAVDASMRMWTMSKVATQNWRNYYPAGSGRGEGTIDNIEYDKLYDTIIELLDIENARVIADVRIPGHPLGILRNGYVATQKSAANGTPQIQIWRVSFRR